MTRTVALRRVAPDDLEPLWPRVASALHWKTAAQLSLSEVRNAVLAGISELWVASDWRYPSRLASVILTTIVVKPRGKRHLKVRFLSGRHAETWIDSTARTLSWFAQTNGCTKLDLIGRRGWMEYRTRFTLPVSWACDERAAHGGSEDAIHHRRLHGTEHPQSAAAELLGRRRGGGAGPDLAQR